jgi:polyisoprenoid-binding protein YceI
MLLLIYTSAVGRLQLKQKHTSIKPTTMATYKIDAAHSEISFKVKHLMISNVTGTFRKFDAS